MRMGWRQKQCTRKTTVLVLGTHFLGTQRTSSQGREGSQERGAATGDKEFYSQVVWFHLLPQARDSVSPQMMVAEAALLQKD